MTNSKIKPIISPVFGIIPNSKSNKDFGVTKQKYMKSKLVVEAKNSDTKKEASTNTIKEEPVKEKDPFENGLEGALFND